MFFKKLVGVIHLVFDGGYEWLNDGKMKVRVLVEGSVKCVIEKGGGITKCVKWVMDGVK